MTIRQGARERTNRNNFGSQRYLLASQYHRVRISQKIEIGRRGQVLSDGCCLHVVEHRWRLLGDKLDGDDQASREQPMCSKRGDVEV